MLRGNLLRRAYRSRIFEQLDERVIVGNPRTTLTRKNDQDQPCAKKVKLSELEQRACGNPTILLSLGIERNERTNE